MSPVSPSISTARHSSPRQSSVEAGSYAAGTSRASASESTSAAPDFNAMWEKVELHRHEASQNPPYFDNSVVAPNHTGVRCLNNPHSLKVRLDNEGGLLAPIHANFVQLSKNGRYAVGQSPGNDFKLGCTRDLIHSLDSGRGLFQFTSRTAHRYDGERGAANATIRNERSLSTIASMIEAQRQPSGVLPMLGERYRITKFEPLPYDTAEKKDVTRYELTARDIHTDEPRTVYITQAGLPFFHKVLEPDSIARAAALLDTHPDSKPPTPVNDGHQQTGPLICSAAGIGRSAVLAVYQDLCNRMPDEVNESNLNVHLEAAIKKGIDTRGPKFLHSKKQVEALRDALLIKMRDAPRQSVDRQSTQRELFNQWREICTASREQVASELADLGGAMHSIISEPNSESGASGSQPSIEQTLPPATVAAVDPALINNDGSDQGLPEGQSGTGQASETGHLPLPPADGANTGDSPVQQVPVGPLLSEAHSFNIGTVVDSRDAQLDADALPLSPPITVREHGVQIPSGALSLSPDGNAVDANANANANANLAPRDITSNLASGHQVLTQPPLIGVANPNNAFQTEHSAGDADTNASLHLPPAPAFENRTPIPPDTLSPRHDRNAAVAAADAAQRNTASDPAPRTVIGTGNMPAPAGSDDADPAVVANNQTDNQTDNQRNVRFVPDSSSTKRRSRATSKFSSEPIELYNYCRQALREANQIGHASIEFSREPLLQGVKPRDGTEPLPEVSAVALAVATISKFTSAVRVRLQSATIDFVTPAQREVYDNLQARVETLKQHRVFQALLRPFIEHRIESTPRENFLDRRKLAVFALPEINDNVDNCDEISKPPAAPDRMLNDIQFDTWEDVPITALDWHDDTNLIEEPALANDCHSAAAVIVEDDGRVWVVAPTNQRGNKKNTFPSGRIGTHSGLTAQAAARKEAYEKSGLQIALTRQLIDIRDANGTTRYYLARRIGGTPADAGWKSQAVSLVPMRKALKVFEDDGRYAYGRERVVVQALQQYTLKDKLDNDENLGKWKTDWKKWLYELAPILPRNPDYLKENNFSGVDRLNVIGYYLSNRLNHLIENWRRNNYQLLGDGVGRPGSAALHAGTALITPPSSIVPYLHANYIRVDGCRIKFIAAQRPQTGPVTDEPVSKASEILQWSKNLLRQLRPTESTTHTALPRQTDNRVTFWQTVFNENINVIVDLDDAKSRTQEAHYGPTDASSLNIGTHMLEVRRLGQLWPKLRIEQIEASGAENVIKGVTRLHYTGWPEGNTIKAEALINLAREVVESSPNRGAKVLVHSTHGVGRAGTLITFIVASEQVTELLREAAGMRPEKLVDIVMNIIARGRAERGGGFVDRIQIQLIFEALLKKHFDGVISAGGDYNGLLRKRA